MIVTLITPTGARPKAFALCEMYMARQSYKGQLQWIVIDDCSAEPTPLTMGQQLIKGPKEWRPGINTQRLNLDAAIPHIKGDYVLVIEDDDYYHKDYIEMMLSHLKWVDVVGEADAIYYHVAYGCYKEMQNRDHASLCSTGFRKSIIPLFEESVNSGEIFIDIHFWEQIQKKKSIKSALVTNTPNFCVGLKGVQGRKGIGVGHTPEGFITDSYDKGMLRKLIGDDIKNYVETN